MAVFSPGVLAAVATFLQFLVNVTIMKSLGMMLVAMQAEFNADTWILGSIFAAVECVSDLLSPLAAPLGKKFGARPVTMVGGCMATAGLVIASQSSTVLQVALSLNILIATGYCFANILVRAELGRLFDDRHFALVYGIAQTGNSVALITQPPLVQLFLNTYGWRGTTLLVGSVAAHHVVSGALLIPAPEVNDLSSTCKYEPLQDMTHKTTDKSQRGTLTSIKSFCLSIGRVFDVSLTKDYNFWIVTFVIVVTRIIRGAWVIYFVPYAIAKGFSNDLAAVMVTAAGVGHLAGSVLVSVALFTEAVTSTNALVVAIMLLAASLFIAPWMNSGWLMSANAILFMAALASVFTLSDVMVKELIGFKRMAAAYGWIGFVSAFSRLFSGFLPGWIYDNYYSYDLAFVILGAIEMTAVVPLVIKMLIVRSC